MLTVETSLGKFSFSLSNGHETFIGETGGASERETVEVTIWQHMNYGRPYGQLVKLTTGVSFCQPNDHFDFYFGARHALQKALDQIGFNNNSDPINKLSHRALRLFCQQEGLI